MKGRWLDKPWTVADRAKGEVHEFATRREAEQPGIRAGWQGGQEITCHYTQNNIRNIQPAPITNSLVPEKKLT